jgi:hypothetical protein
MQRQRVRRVEGQKLQLVWDYVDFGPRSARFNDQRGERQVVIGARDPVPDAKLPASPAVPA